MGMWCVLMGWCGSWWCCCCGKMKFNWVLVCGVGFGCLCVLRLSVGRV